MKVRIIKTCKLYEENGFEFKEAFKPQVFYWFPIGLIPGWYDIPEYYHPEGKNYHLSQKEAENHAQNFLLGRDFKKSEVVKEWRG